jgi:hypothetical protein
MIPGAILTGYLAFWFGCTCIDVEWITLVLVLLSYPTGMVCEEASLLLNRYAFQIDKVEKKIYNAAPLETDGDGFWGKYLTVLELSQHLGGTIERYDTARFFFLNQSFVGIVILILDLARSGWCFKGYHLPVAIAICLLYYGHRRATHGFFYIVGKAHKIVEKAPRLPPPLI